MAPRQTEVQRIAELEAKVKYWPEKHTELSERKNREEADDPLPWGAAALMMSSVRSRLPHARKR